MAVLSVFDPLPRPCVPVPTLGMHPKLSQVGAEGAGRGTHSHLPRSCSGYGPEQDGDQQAAHEPDEDQHQAVVIETLKAGIVSELPAVSA